jgi:hypothetical protein
LRKTGKLLNTRGRKVLAKTIIMANSDIDEIRTVFMKNNPIYKLKTSNEAI